ncbi:MAG: hypothetical protein ACW976_05490, partial [Candidatus Ranarchaeia archaeon]
KEKLSEAIGMLDGILGKQSFFVASDLLHTSSTQSDPQELHSILEVSSSEKPSRETDKDFTLRSEETGTPLAKIHIEDSTLTITPIPEKIFKQTDPELQEFFMGKVMKEIQKTNRDMTIKIDEKKDFIKTISVSNITEERQLNRILGAARWAFTKILEKS